MSWPIDTRCNLVSQVDVPWEHHCYWSQVFERYLFLHFWSTVLENDSILIDTDCMIFTTVFYRYQICSVFIKLLHYILFYVAMTHRSVKSKCMVTNMKVSVYVSQCYNITLLMKLNMKIWRNVSLSNVLASVQWPVSESKVNLGLKVPRRPSCALVTRCAGCTSDTFSGDSTFQLQIFCQVGIEKIIQWYVFSTVYPRPFKLTKRHCIK